MNPAVQMIHPRMVLWLACGLACVHSHSAGFSDDSPAIKLGKSTTSKWRIGVEVTAEDSPVTGITATSPVPMDWPEQKVTILEEELAPKSKLNYRVIDDAVKQMVVTIPKLSRGETARIAVVFEVEKFWIEEPESHEGLKLPKATRDLAKFLGPSPYIESNDVRIKQVAASEAEDDAEPWDQAHQLFTWTRANVKYKFDKEIKPAIDALKSGEGDCEELSSLFIAFCRNRKIPARAVWVPDHTYPEFYLEDANGKGHWYPCQAAGEAADFGRMPENRPILQKGDNLKLPGESSPQRYCKQSVRAKNAPSPPKVKFILERAE